MKEEIYHGILKEYGLDFKCITYQASTSFENDNRETVVLDNKWVLRGSSSKEMTEERISELSFLIERYCQFGIYAPQFKKTLKGNYIVALSDKNFYVSEYADYPLASDIQINSKSLLYQKIKHLGGFANEFTNQNLMKTRSMWSILDLAPLDKGIDEKQENCNTLCTTLKKFSLDALANQIETYNEKNRNAIQRVFKDLPRCVYQGDLNDTNILMKDNQFYGLIDFNMAGTEVNINCFLAETAYLPEEKDFMFLSATSILDKMVREQDEALKIILENYSLNSIEKSVFENYRNLILMFQYPNVCAYIYYLSGEHRTKIIELIHLMISREGT